MTLPHKPPLFADEKKPTRPAVKALKKKEGSTNIDIDDAQIEEPKDDVFDAPPSPESKKQPR